MISHRHRCIFTHVPKTAGKAMLSAFGLPMLGADYLDRLPHIDLPYGHQRLADHTGRREFAYYKFAFVRNPWDRLVSSFFYLNAGGCNDDDRRVRDVHLARYRGEFRAFVRDLGRHVEHQHFRPQLDWVTDRAGRLLPDFIGRYETLEADFAVVAERLSLPWRLPHLNASAHGPYRTCYDNETRAIAARVYARDIEAFGYAF